MFGDVKNSIDILLDIYKNEDKNEKPVTYLTAKLNLLELKQLSENSFHFDDDIKKKLFDIEDKSEENSFLIKHNIS